MPPGGRKCPLFIEISKASAALKWREMFRQSSVTLRHERDRALRVPHRAVHPIEAQAQIAEIAGRLRSSNRWRMSTPRRPGAARGSATAPGCRGLPARAARQRPL